MVSSAFLVATLPLLAAAQLDGILGTGDAGSSEDSGSVSGSDPAFNPYPYNPGFDIETVAATAKALPSHSWEYGSACEALLELHNPGAYLACSVKHFLTSLKSTQSSARMPSQPSFSTPKMCPPLPMVR